MEQLKLNVPINTEDVIANVSDIKPISAYDAKKIKGVWPDVFPNYTSPTLDDNDICAKQLRVPTNQKALKINDVDFRINPLKDDISSLLIEDVRQTVEQKFHTKKYMIRLNWDQPTCLIFGIPTNNNSTNNDSTAPLEFKSTGSVHHHDGLTSPATPTPKPKMPVNNENITRKQLEELVNRLVKEREEKLRNCMKRSFSSKSKSTMISLKSLKSNIIASSSNGNNRNSSYQRTINMLLIGLMIIGSILSQRLSTTLIACIWDIMSQYMVVKTVRATSLKQSATSNKQLTLWHFSLKNFSIKQSKSHQMHNRTRINASQKVTN